MEVHDYPAPTNFLNDRYDGPHAFSRRQSVRAYNITRWLLEYAFDNQEVNGGDRAQWHDAEHMLSIYHTDDGNEHHFTLPDITERGAGIINNWINWTPGAEFDLEAAEALVCRNESPSDAAAMQAAIADLDKWQREIQAA